MNRVGLLGGSFNPAHSGHLQVSREALRRLKLDQVWWLVSPQNPLKKPSELADYEVRLSGAKQLAAAEKRIRVTDIERRLNTRYSIDTLKRLQKKFPRTRFVWLMGADNLAQFHRWRRWAQIFKLVSVAVFDRAPYSHRALHSPTALRFAAFRLPDSNLNTPILPAWSYTSMRKNPASSTAIRKKLGKAQVLRHNQTSKD